MSGDYFSAMVCGKCFVYGIKTYGLSSYLSYIYAGVWFYFVIASFLLAICLPEDERQMIHYSNNLYINGYYCSADWKYYALLLNRITSKRLGMKAK